MKGGEMEEVSIKLETYINNCLLRKLSKSFNESESHSEYMIRNKKMNEYMPKLIKLLEEVDLKQIPEVVSSSLYCILILYLELQSVGPWNCNNSKDLEYSEKLDQTFKTKYGVGLKDILQENNFDPQQIFDKSVKEIHQKMTYHDLKRYPGLIEVYCSLISNLKSYKVIVKPVIIIPVSLLLIDDYVPANKVKGLKCCALIMQCLNKVDFTSGNYYEVVYISLKKNIVEKNLEVTKCLFSCLLQFLSMLQPDIQKSKLNDVFSSVVDQLQIESNLHRKAACFDFVSKIIEMHGVHCVRKKMFTEVIADSLDLCTNEGVSGILLHHILECLQMWIKYCWCVWKLSSHHKVLSKLFILLYLAKEESTQLQIQNIIIALIKLCTKDEQTQICKSLDTIDKTDLQNSLGTIKDKIKT